MTSSNQVYTSGSVSIPNYGPLLLLESSDVFAVGRPAMVVCSKSGEGKTVAAVDAVYTLADSITGLVYVTNTYDTPANGYLREMIPAIHVKNWDVELISHMWGEVVQNGLQISRALSDKVLDQFISTWMPQNRAMEEEMRLLQTTIDSNRQLFTDQESLKAAIVAHQKVMKMTHIKTAFPTPHPAMGENDRAVLTAVNSSPPCFVAIFDDITGFLKTPPPDIFVPTIGESGEISSMRVKGAKGMDELLKSILTVARHFAFVAFFIHTLEAFTPSVRSQFGGVMFMGADSVREGSRQTVIPEGDKILIEAAWDVAKDFPHHKVVYYTNAEMTNHKQKVALFKPRLHTRPHPIGTATFQAVMNRVQQAISIHQGSSLHQARVRAAEIQSENIVQQLAREGANQLQTQPQFHPQTQSGGLSRMLS